MNKIKFRRGSLNNKKNIDIEEGEPIYLTDTKRLYVSNEDVAINNVYVGTQEPNDPGINVWINPQGINNVVDMIYPIGSIYLSVNNVNPSSVFGGSWESFGTGRTLVGVDTSQTEFNTVEKTGGEKTHTLIETELPYIRGDFNFHGAGSATVGSGCAGYFKPGAYRGNYRSGGSDLGGAGSYDGFYFEFGGNQPHNNLQPYITCYMWKRVG